jgi:hypothetical protein
MRQELGPLALLADEGALESPPAPGAVRVPRLGKRRQVVRVDCIDLKLRTLGWCIGQIHENLATGQLSVEYAGHLARYLTDFGGRCHIAMCGRPRRLGDVDRRSGSHDPVPSGGALSSSSTFRRALDVIAEAEQCRSQVHL